MRLLLYALILMLAGCAGPKEGPVEVNLAGQIQDIPYTVHLKGVTVGRARLICTLAFALTCDCESELAGDDTQGTIIIEKCQPRHGSGNSCFPCNHTVDYSSSGGTRIFVSRTYGQLMVLE